MLQTLAELSNDFENSAFYTILLKSVFRFLSDYLRKLHYMLEYSIYIQIILKLHVTLIDLYARGLTQMRCVMDQP